jgi:lipid II:glycine glycyltransferase (peptidoglycan interpeptide bridge formation enzyme)
LLQTDKVKYYLAKYGERYISGAIILYGKRNCFYWSGAMLEEYRRYCPNNLLLKCAIEDACNNGYHYFNMGASIGLPGVQRFKESFGAEKLDYKYFVYESPLLTLYKNFVKRGKIGFKSLDLLKVILRTWIQPTGGNEVVFLASSRT